MSNSYYQNLTIAELQDLIASFQRQEEYGEAMMQSCGYSLALSSSRGHRQECERILASKLANNQGNN